MYVCIFNDLLSTRTFVNEKNIWQLFMVLGQPVTISVSVFSNHTKLTIFLSCQSKYQQIFS